MEQQLVIDKIVVPSSDSACPDWKRYYKDLRAEFLKDDAKMFWMFTFQQVGSVSCQTNADFIKWAQSKGMDISNAASRMVADVTKIGENMLGLGVNMTGAVKFIMPIVLIGGISLALYLAFRVARNAKLSDLANVLPQTRIAKLALGK